jgi:hypothetical protein
MPKLTAERFADILREIVVSRGVAAIPSPGEKVPQFANWGGSGTRAARYDDHKGIDLLRPANLQV